MLTHAKRTIFRTPQAAFEAIPRTNRDFGYYMMPTDGGYCVQVSEAGWEGRFLGYL